MQMDKYEAEGTRVTFMAPNELVSAVQAAAKRDLSSVSYLCRKALVAELKERGLLPDKA
jgi:hypothetical protein